MVKIKHPSKNGEPFKGLFLQLKTPFLRKMVSEINFDPKAKRLRPETTPYILLPEHPFLKGFFKSLESYFDAQEYPSEALMENKEKEAVLTLLQVKPEVVSLLFDFAEPFKIDLESYMNDNYKSDLDISEFAHYTGHDLSAFKKTLERLSISLLADGSQSADCKRLGALWRTVRSLWRFTCKWASKISAISPRLSNASMASHLQN